MAVKILISTHFHLKKRTNFSQHFISLFLWRFYSLKFVRFTFPQLQSAFTRIPFANVKVAHKPVFKKHIVQQRYAMSGIKSLYLLYIRSKVKYQTIFINELSLVQVSAVTICRKCSRMDLILCASMVCQTCQFCGTILLIINHVIHGSNFEQSFETFHSLLNFKCQLIFLLPKNFRL